MVYHEPGKVTDFPDQAIGILAVLGIISSGIACHSLWDSIIAAQNDDIEQEKRSYLSLFLSFVYYIWFMAIFFFVVFDFILLSVCYFIFVFLVYIMLFYN